MEKKEIYIYSWTKCIVRVSTGWRQVALLRRRQDNVHSLAGVVLAYSLFFQLASSCSTSSRIVWMVCINRMASLIRRLEPFRTVMLLKDCIAVSIGKCGREKSLEVFENVRKLFEYGSVSKKDGILWCGTVSFELDGEDRLFCSKGIKCVGKVGRFIWEGIECDGGRDFY